MSKKVIEEDSGTGDVRRTKVSGGVSDESITSRGVAGRKESGRAVMEEKVPIMFDEKEFQYSYRCGHCGHEWSEVYEETKTTEEGKQGYTGD